MAAKNENKYQSKSVVYDKYLAFLGDQSVTETKWADGWEST